ncbi:TadE/TadG family type IV pilus assembly protein [Croceicoccus sp. YJ47]|uniref:TadE/TadG family type IV pilus assembly protein n=1 Tax=Croceicoccus sp. YJ47 TaxID=2798724 RepID=UPI00192417A3|nr:TadE family protein [Croceicoccus sp. YJ47]QQN74173.1 pilus assembly protein [Croceicoccus sp. YJ47]
MIRSLRDDETGAVAVEFALWSMLFFMVVASALDIGSFFMKRSRLDEALSASAIVAFDNRENVRFDQLPAYVRALSDDTATSVILSCNGVVDACTNMDRSCACISADGGYSAYTCKATCPDNGARAGYYMTVEATTPIEALIIPQRAFGGDTVTRATTLRLE